MDEFITLYLKNNVTLKTYTFAYNIDIFSNIVKSMVNDLGKFMNRNDLYELWLDWTNTPPIDTQELFIQITDKKADTHFGYILDLYRLDDPMCELEHILFSLVNDSDIDYLNKDNYKMEVLTW